MCCGGQDRHAAFEGRAGIRRQAVRQRPLEQLLPRGRPAMTCSCCGTMASTGMHVHGGKMACDMGAPEWGPHCLLWADASHRQHWALMLQLQRCCSLALCRPLCGVWPGQSVKALSLGTALGTVCLRHSLSCLRRMLLEGTILLLAGLQLDICWPHLQPALCDVPPAAAGTSC